MPVRTGPTVLHLENVALCPRLLTILVSLRQLRRKGIFWDNEHNLTTLKRRDRLILCKLRDIHGQYVIDYQPHEVQSAFNTWRKKHTTYTKRRPLTGEAILWHGRLGYPGPSALEHLVSSSQGVRIQGPTTVECEACALAKITRQICRALREILEREGERIALDFHDYEPGINNYMSQLLLTCRVLGLIWDYYLESRNSTTLLNVMKSFLGIM